MKVPTYHKYGLTKQKVDKSELRDRKISDILTHHLTITIGVVLGIIVYILNYAKVQPSNIIQALGQVFLFASMGVICVGIPAVLFKLAEMFYFRYISPRSEEKQSIKKYYEDRHEYDFWKIRKDYSFWRVLDGLSFEREVMNLLMHLGYLPLNENNINAFLSLKIVAIKDKKNYIVFNTSSEIDRDMILQLCLMLKEKKFDNLMFFSQKGIKDKTELEVFNNIELFDIHKIIKLVQTVVIN